LRDKVSIAKIKQKLKHNENARLKVRKIKWGWAGHVARMAEERWAKKVTWWYLGNYKRRRGKQKIR